MNAKEFIRQRIQNDWNGKIYLGFYEDEEIDIFELMEGYHKSKTENLPISVVVEQSEQLKAFLDYVDSRYSEQGTRDKIVDEFLSL